MGECDQPAGPRTNMNALLVGASGAAEGERSSPKSQACQSLLASCRDLASRPLALARAMDTRSLTRATLPVIAAVTAALTQCDADATKSHVFEEREGRLGMPGHSAKAEIR